VQVEHLTAGRSTGHDRVTKVQMSISGMTCSACVSNITSALEQHGWIVPESISVNLVGNSATMQLLGDHEAVELIEIMDDLGYDSTIEDTVLVSAPERNAEIGSSDVWKASFAIEGMTCSACVSTIKTSLQDIPWVRSIDVNLVGNSATVIVEG